jgi:hypothetical protein
LSSRVGSWASSAAVVLLLALPVGCGGDDDDDNNGENRPRPVAGTFVGKLQGSEELVAVVAAPPAKGEDRRDVSAFVCDAKQVCAWFTGSANGNAFVAKSGDGEGQTKVLLRGKTASGTVTLSDAEPGRYKASEATATAGLYDLTVSRKGKVTGASAAGVGLTGQLTLPPPGDGQLKLADGTRIKFKVTEASEADTANLRPGQLRMIVLPSGQVSGAGKSRGAGGGSDFFVSSAPKK